VVSLVQLVVIAFAGWKSSQAEYSNGVHAAIFRAVMLLGTFLIALSGSESSADGRGIVLAVAGAGISVWFAVASYRMVDNLPAASPLHERAKTANFAWAAAAALDMAMLVFALLSTMAGAS
jgi:hypothetical protein